MSTRENSRLIARASLQWYLPMHGHSAKDGTRWGGGVLDSKCYKFVQALTHCFLLPELNGSARVKKVLGVTHVCKFYMRVKVSSVV